MRRVFGIEEESLFVCLFVLASHTRDCSVEDSDISVYLLHEESEFLILDKVCMTC